jgi:hypothetical protein
VVDNRLVRRFVVGLSVLGVLGLALLPTEHVHASRNHDDRHPDVIHRHFEPHHLFDAAAAIDHDGDDAQYLSALFISTSSPTSVNPVTQFVIADLPAAQPPQLSRWNLSTIHVRVHDPPWITSHGLRGPPTLLV